MRNKAEIMAGVLITIMWLALCAQAFCQERPSRKFIYVFHKKTYDDAILYAQKRGGQLVTIEDAMTQKVIHKMMRSKNIWIGINDRDQEGRWLWQDGTKANYTNWRQRPRRTRSKNVAMMDKSGKWIATVGHPVKRPFVIEVEIDKDERQE